MTRKILLNMLENVTREDQPVLGRIDGDHWGNIILWPNRNAVATGKSLTLNWVNMSLPAGKYKLEIEWIKYNRWLHNWYLGKGLDTIAVNTHEHRTQLRAAGYSEEKVEKTIEDLKADRLRYEEYKKAAVVVGDRSLVTT